MTDELEKQAKKYFSDIRLFRYSNQDDLIGAYFDNLKVSENLLSMISVFEVIFRNKINSVLVVVSKDYLTNQKINIFNKEEKGIIKNAYKEAKKINIKESKVLTILTLGFWCKLILNRSLWGKYLNKIFPIQFRQEVKPKIIFNQIHLILKVRNKIAHHERVVKKEGIQLNEVLDAITILTLSLIDKKDENFRAYIRKFLEHKANAIRLIVDRKG